MHTLIVIAAYMSMILVPCACAQWGDVLTADFWNLRIADYRYRQQERRLRRTGATDALLLAVREARAITQIETLANAAFTSPAITEPEAYPTALPAFVHQVHAARAARPTESIHLFDRATVRVTQRLAELSEAFRRAHAAELAALPAASSPRKPPTRALPEVQDLALPVHQDVLRPAVATVSRISQTHRVAPRIPTPSAAELEAIYALPSEATPIHLVPAPEPVPATEDISIAA